MMDLPWPIAADFNDYVDKALKLAAEPDIRRQLAQDLAARSDLLFQPSDCATRIADFMVDSVLRKEAA
jgi:predicted O-linked N-acetylglucosamine transferase (SPINDLY family)